MFAYLVQAIWLGLVAAAQPGPFQTYIISQTIHNGWRRTLPAAFAPLLSDGPIIALVLLVLSQVPATFQNALYTAGGLFILYLAWGMGRAWRAFDPAAQMDGEPPRYGIFKAAFINLLNPNPYIFWSLVTGPILIAGWREAPAHGMAFLAGFYGVMIGGFIAIILLFGMARRLGSKVNRAMLGVSTLLLAGFGLYQLGRGIAGWVVG
jgi:threonine/homoserine/homoserine lactone efflux protein